MFFGKEKKKGAELALPADESEDEIGFCDHEDDLDWTVEGSRKRWRPFRLVSRQDRYSLVNSVSYIIQV